ncbi:MAG: 2-C-methyl-D-erythritol 4-phosphate cytidylyltransferase [Lachnospiraceae bacterium]|nr:2-C-methyl-D-erythritol 4-phosphate cytidylyltransferase [Lachnospiraceae bacterium]MBR6271911.1 2-C-methyl-D-erythritol 4-phosphate cytidylyltransferase [Lachnospiraceae bacterium]
MHLRKSVAGILLAGGNATRFGGSINKVYLPLGGKPVISYSLEALDSHPEIDELIIVVREGEDSMIDTSRLRKPFKVIHGGSSRRGSVLNALMATDADLIVIQDGARPFLREYYITDCLNALDDYPGATIAVRSKDTVKIAFENQLVQRTPKRTNTWLVQTPQCFRRSDLVKAHLEYTGVEATDDCMMLEYFRKDVLLVSGDDTNIKITTKNDFSYAEYLLKEKIFV